ncbi:MAG: hypothetical protein Q8933_14035 [Bacteroidota bacterium]|nr:hypothetical protein [Bacteroidota bacterium]
MLVHLKKQIKNLPAAILWIWIGIVFADAANLDDFFFKNSIIHTDIQESSEQYFSGVQLTGVSHFSTYNSSQEISRKTQTFPKIKKYSYDEDSPSLAPDISNSSEGICSVLQNGKQFHKFIPISKLLYLQNCTLLI